MRFAPSLVCVGLVSLALFACGSTPSTATAVARPQLVAVDPDDILGSVRCAPPLEDVSADAVVDLTAARSYVATLFDVTPTSDGGTPDPGIPLASSPPTTCLMPVTFSFVVTGHRYVAEVDAYHQRPDDLTPISPGSRLMFNAEGTRALPGWAFTCGGYPPSPYVEAGAESPDAGAESPDAGPGERPPGVVSYASITQTPHNCKPGLFPAESN